MLMCRVLCALLFWKGVNTMNEKQRVEAGQVVTGNSSDKKSEKDFSKYFESVYVPPSLKDAKKRGKEEVAYQDFSISDEFKNLGDGKKFIFVRMVVR